MKRNLLKELYRGPEPVVDREELARVWAKAIPGIKFSGTLAPGIIQLLDNRPMRYRQGRLQQVQMGDSIHRCVSQKDSPTGVAMVEQRAYRVVRMSAEGEPIIIRNMKRQIVQSWVRARK